MKVASVRRTAEFYYRLSTFHVPPVSSILTEHRAALKESSIVSKARKKLFPTIFEAGTFVPLSIARRSQRLIRGV